ncbi:MAG: ABC transporter permease [Proteobacteria bacterium]|nr:ABC transporter permease [Pseudomonadota bacterium]HQR04669.1 ABC transporter permease [Rhodocyclaceae bacterium]
MTGKTEAASEFSLGLKIQKRILWTLLLREIITRYGRENLGILWFFVEPLLFIVGISILWTYFDSRTVSTGTLAEFSIVSYPTILLWRNTTSRVTKAMYSNRPLLHHRLIKPVDFMYARIILEFASVTASFIVIYIVFLLLGISHAPADLLDMALGWLMICWFSFGFVMIMGALSELNDAIEKVSHIILYFMLPISGILPAYIVPPSLREYLLLFPLVDCVEFFRYGYYGMKMKTYFNLEYTILVNLVLTLFSMSLMKVAINKMQRS